MPLDVEALAKTILALCRKDQFELARSRCGEAYARALSNSDRARVLRELAYVESSAGEITECVSLLLRAQTLDPGNRGTAHALIRALVEAESYTDARQACLSLIDLDKQYPIKSFTSSAYFHLAFCEFKLGEVLQAELALSECNESAGCWIGGGFLDKSGLMAMIHARHSVQ